MLYQCLSYSNLTLSDSSRFCFLGCCSVFFFFLCVCAHLWPAGKRSVPFRSECEGLSQESLAEHCYVKLMPPTTRTSPHITGRLIFFLFSSLSVSHFSLFYKNAHIHLLGFSMWFICLFNGWFIWRE